MSLQHVQAVNRGFCTCSRLMVGLRDLTSPWMSVATLRDLTASSVSVAAGRSGPTDGGSQITSHCYTCLTIVFEASQRTGRRGEVGYRNVKH